MEHVETNSEDLSGLPAVILAGGFGTRVQHLLRGIPKPMAPVLGRPFIEWVVRYLLKQGIHKVVISTGHLAETVKRHFENRPVEGVELDCIAETKALGTAGGFLNAAWTSGWQPDCWLVLNGDSLALASIQEMAMGLSDPAVSGVVLGVQMADASRYGTLAQDATGRLVRFEEKKPGPGLINAGIYLLRTARLEPLPGRRPLSFEKDVFPALLDRQCDLRVHCAEAPFLDIGTPESLAQADVFVRAHRDQFEEYEA